MNQRSLKILYLSPPWTYKAIRSLHVAKALSDIAHVDRIIVHAEDSRSSLLKDVSADFDIIDQIDTHPQPKRSPLKKISYFINARAPYPHGMKVALEDEARLRRQILDYDLVWFFKFRTINMFSSWRWPRSVLDIDDLPSGVYGNPSSQRSTVKTRFSQWVQAMQWRRREALLGERFTSMSVCSEDDRARFKDSSKLHVIPNGFERPIKEPQRSVPTGVRFGFIGLFDYFANREGIEWFISECWPLIIERIPGARLRLVGRGSDSLAVNKTHGIDFLGWVDNSAAEIATWSVMIIPLHKGGGTRVKIAEGFSLKCPMVSTRVGAYGYDVTDGRQLRLADTPSEFANACITLALNPQEACQMAERAWCEFTARWTWDAIAPKVHQTAYHCLQNSS